VHTIAMPDAATKTHPASRTTANLRRRYVIINPAIQQNGLMTASMAGTVTADGK
jgi:hypothetical protein